MYVLAFIASIVIAGCDAKAPVKPPNEVPVVFQDGPPPPPLVDPSAEENPDPPPIPVIKNLDPDNVQSFDGTLAPPPYPWPPERPSTQEALTHLFASKRSISLRDVGEVLAATADQAGYADKSFYSAPNGFVLATRLEATTAEGKPLEGLKRYQLPVAGSRSITDAVTDLSGAMAPGNFRYIAFVVTDQPITYSQEQLPSAVTNRALGGSTNLTDAFDRPFTSKHVVLALIYEFTAAGEPVNKIELRRPSLLSGADHIAAAGFANWLRVKAKAIVN